MLLKATRADETHPPAPLKKKKVYGTKIQGDRRAAKYRAILPSCVQQEKHSRGVFLLRFAPPIFFFFFFEEGALFYLYKREEGKGIN